MARPTASTPTPMLQVIFSFFLGVVVVAFVAITVTTVLPEPRSTEPFGPVDEALRQSWSQTVSVTLLVCATALLVASLIRAENLLVISNGLLLGGVFTMVYAMGFSLSSGQSVTRVVVAGIALVVTIGVGYLKFVRSRRVPTGGSGDSMPTVAGSAVPDQVDLADRLSAVEQRLDAVAAAFRGDAPGVRQG